VPCLPLVAGMFPLLATRTTGATAAIPPSVTRSILRTTGIVGGTVARNESEAKPRLVHANQWCGLS
jgi:hypothetical protein